MIDRVGSLLLRAIAATHDENVPWSASAQRVPSRASSALAKTPAPHTTGPKARESAFRRRAAQVHPGAGEVVSVNYVGDIV